MFKNQKTNASLTSAAAAVAAVSARAAPAPARAACPLDPPPPSCDDDGQFIGGRWDLSALTSSHAPQSFFDGFE